MLDILKKTGLMTLIFSRVLIIITLVILQLVILSTTFLWFYDFIEFILGGFSLITIILVIWIVNNQSNPAFKLAWILPILIFPVLGGFFYVFVETNFGGRTFSKKVQEGICQTKGLLKTDLKVIKDIRENSIYNLSTYVQQVSGYPIYQNTAIQYYPLGEYKFEAMKMDLKNATSFIFLEYFIIEEGKMWNELLTILHEKAKEGIDVRVMYDGIGTLRTLPRKYHLKLKEMGIKTKVFSPVVPLISTHQNNRDHRKILVIDGKIAYNGGVNLADEYINEKVVYGHWKDVAIRLEGDAVSSFTLMFLQMWNIDEKEENIDNFLNKSSSIHSKGFVMPYADNPLDHDRIGEVVYMDMIYQAKNCIHIMTPYLIIDNEMLTALCVRAKSGVDVKLMLPHIPDQKIPFDIARSYYPQLIESGVKIYEYIPGFVHAKMFIVDHHKAVVGTINMDYRSLYHHFECATYMQDIPEIQKMEEDFQSTLKQCQIMTQKKYKQIHWFSRIMGKVFRLLAPLV